ncbi:MAG TPA: EAL domain-containing protein [Acetobacteraceae bacterium]|nr:EAL domain-containing protein [Acetobacteraceae bacterium]
MIRRLAVPVIRRLWRPAATLPKGLHPALAFGTALLLLTIAAGTALQLHRTYDAAMRAAADELANAALITEHVVNRQLLQVDSALLRLPAMLSANGSTAVDQRAATRALRSFYFETFAFRDVLLVAPDGSIWAATRPRPGRQPLPFPLPSEKLMRGTSAELAGPVLNPTTGTWSLFLLRPLDLPGQESLTAVAEIPVSFITDLLAPIGSMPGLEIDVEREDGMLLTSVPHDERRIGRQSGVAIPGGLPGGRIFDTQGSSTAQPAIATWRRTLYPGVAIALTLDLSTALRDWQQERGRLIAQNVLTGLLILAVALALHVVVRVDRRMDAERRKSRDMLDGAIEAMSDGFVMWDENDRLVTCNRRYREFYEISAPFIRAGASFADIIRQGALRGQYPEAGPDIEAFVQSVVEWHRGDNPATERALPGGRWLQIKEHPIPTGGIVGIRTDISTMKQTLSDLAQAKDRVSSAMAELKVQHDVLIERDETLHNQNMLFDAALNNMSQGLVMVDPDARLIVCNQRFLDMFRITIAHARPGADIAQVLAAIVANGGLTDTAMETMIRHHQDHTWQRTSGEVTIKDGKRLALFVSQRPLPDGGWVATYEDVTEHELAEERIEFMAHHDELTRLPNRVLFRMRMEEALRRIARSREGLMLLYLDLDKFKYVNDTLGHPTGDALLKAVAGRLQECLRECDTVARLGGDEFAAIVVSDDLASLMVPMAHRIIDTISEPYQIHGRKLQIGVSIGIAITDAPDIDCDVLLKRADMALYSAKAKNPGGYCLFEREFEESMRHRLAIEADLRRALVTEQLQVFYQPIVDLATGEPWGFEALLRWNHPDRGLVSPVEFIPLAEELGLIKLLGAWLVRRVCADMTLIPAPLKVAVNLSPRQLDDDDLIEDVTEALAYSGMEASRFEFEITESALLNKSMTSRSILLSLRNMGATIALDDFGTGYSSLSYLTSFPLDKLKIDRSFISQMAVRHDSAAIVRSIVELAHQLHMTTTAEGVETAEQLELVRRAGCTNVQGYLTGRPAVLKDALRALHLWPDELAGAAPPFGVLTGLRKVEGGQEPVS